MSAGTLQARQFFSVHAHRDNRSTLSIISPTIHRWLADVGLGLDAVTRPTATASATRSSRRRHLVEATSRPAAFGTSTYQHGRRHFFLVARPSYPTLQRTDRRLTFFRGRRQPRFLFLRPGLKISQLKERQQSLRPDQLGPLVRVGQHHGPAPRRLPAWRELSAPSGSFGGSSSNRLVRSQTASRVLRHRRGRRTQSLVDRQR